MTCFGLLRYALSAAMAVCVMAPVVAQNTVTGPADKPKSVPAPMLPTPFSVDAAVNEERSIEVRAAKEMTQVDKLLVANAESSIAEQASLSGFDIRQGVWNYQQVVCPALPNHLFLQYVRKNDAGDITIFSASIPRRGAGKVRIIPIRRRGYSLFSPTPVNALTISAFNHIRAEEPEDQHTRDWLGNGFCYAALSGSRPHLPDNAEAPARKPVHTLVAILDVRSEGGEVVRFADETDTSHPLAWSMTFTRSGRLVKVTRTPIQLNTEKPVPEDGAVPALQQVPPAR